MKKLLIAMMLVAVAGCVDRGYQKESEISAEVERPSLVFEKAWIRLMPSGSRATAFYFTLKNQDRVPVRITGFSAPWAKQVAMHTTERDNDIVSMVPLDVVEVAPGQSVVFKPSGRHGMLMGITEPLKLGEKRVITIEFEQRDSIALEFAVLKD